MFGSGSCCTFEGATHRQQNEPGLTQISMGVSANSRPLKRLGFSSNCPRSSPLSLKAHLDTELLWFTPISLYHEPTDDPRSRVFGPSQLTASSPTGGRPHEAGLFRIPYFQLDVSFVGWGSWGPKRWLHAVPERLSKFLV